MKHIISLSMKYIRRQKMRTVLTFLCVTLSVFILCTFGAYIGSTLQTLQNQCMREQGSAEADLSPWFKKLREYDEIENVIDIIQNHILVSDYNADSETIIEDYKGIRLGERSEENSNILTFMEFDNGSEVRRLSRVYEMAYMGNDELLPEGSFHAEFKSDLRKNEGSIMPIWVQDMGYSVGDTITFTLRPVIAEIDEDDELMKEVRQKRFDEYGTSAISGEPEWDELDNETKVSIKANNIIQTFEYYDMTFNDIPLKNIEYGEPIEVSLKIAGFLTDAGNATLTVVSSDMDSFFNNKLVEKNSDDLTYWYYGNAYVRINENIDFDDGMEMLYEDLGFLKGNYYADLPILNYELLFLEFRSAGSLVEAIPTIITIFVLIFFAWLVARFVIDNAFEISNKERGLQFATLRIMGASKPQICALIFTEALLYTITAVPIGTISAYVLCKYSFNSLKNIGFQDFEYKANMYFVIGGIILCIAAIFISAYTSAMWASRKLSLTEAMNVGKPKKTRHRKSKIRLNSKQFLRRYTSKNIARSKGRYIISTITMALGTMFFAFSMMLGMTIMTFYDNIIDDENHDFYISMLPFDIIDEAMETFDSDAFSKVSFKTQMSGPDFAINTDSVDISEFEKLLPYKKELTDKIFMFGIGKDDFDKYIAETSGMTYDEFVQSGGAVYNIPCYGNIEYDENSKPIRKYDDYYQKFDVPLTVEYQNGISVDVIGGACSEFWPVHGLIVPINSDTARQMDLLCYMEATVNGQKNYPEAVRLFNDFVKENDIFSYYNGYMYNTGIREFAKAIIKIAVTFIMAIWLVGILSMVNSINTSVLNRRREFMMLRSIGMSRKQLRKMVLLESIMYSALASSIGILIAIGVFFIMFRGVTMLVPMAVGLLVTIGVNIIIAILASIPGSKNLEKAEALIRTF